jgi:hypothetical protein
LVAAVASCGRCAAPAQPVVEAITIDAFEGAEIAAMSDVQLRDRLAARLGERGFRIVKAGGSVPPEVKGWRLTLAAGLAEPDAEANRGADVMVVLHARQRGAADGLEVRAHERRAATSNDLEALEDSIRQAVESALDQAVEELRVTIELAGAPREALIARLKGASPAAGRAVVRLLVEERDPAALPPVLMLLKSPDVNEVREAVGLLVQLKAPQAVNPMIEASHLQPPSLQREIVFAIGSIGGEDAEAFLDLVSGGSDDPSVREAATQALAELRTKKNRSP